MVDTRKPAAAGRFYPGKGTRLRKKVEECFKSELGPGKIPEKGEIGDIRAGIVPHAGYDYSGPAASYFYSELVESGIPDTVVVMGTMHTPVREKKPGITTKQDFKTPLGELEVDKEVVEELVAEKAVLNDPKPHRREHSIEVQLPFLQYFSSEFKLVPIGVPTKELEEAKRLGRALKNILGDKNAVYIASTDFSHCGMSYGQLPPGEKSAGEYAEEKDRKAIDRIENMKLQELFETIREEEISICGPGAIYALMSVLENGSNAELLKYYTSQELGSGSNAVGYASISFR
ncbi:MAG: AmmeMemoRadiSam system protein B [Candidatus Nanohaloarchaeota archaeon QJJ-9]|nr:AmmeMemoRadiSam system protein B [Candidatus Nanohaloarchaeota archaeon QJJ-9]